MTLTASWKTGGASRQVNGKNVALSGYLAVLPALSWSAQDNPLLDGERRARRRLLDQGVVAKKPLSVEVLAQYRQILAAKRSLLMRGSSESLEPWNQLLAEAGHQLIRLRHAYAAQLERAFTDIVAELGIELPTIRLRYQPNPTEGNSLEEFVRVLSAAERTERQRQRALLGPHRDDLRIDWGSADISRVASTGERKLFGLILTAARRRVLAASGSEPLILLDDLDAALDRQRLVELWQLFVGLPQVVVSSADRDLGSLLGQAQSWAVEAGRIEAL